jgi:hypothetical protein
MISNRKLIGIEATALSLALAVATPAFAVGLRGGGVMHVGSGGFRGDQVIVGPVLPSADAAPAFAQDAVGPGYGVESQLVTNYRSNHRTSHRGPYDQNFRGAYNQSGASFYARPPTNEERRNLEDFGFSGRDPSRVGGEDPYLHPGG